MEKDTHRKQAGRRRIIVHTPEPSAGAGQYVAEFVGGLSAEGERVTLFCPANFSYETDVLARGVEIIRAPVREIEQAPLARRVFRNVAFATGALQKLWTNVRRGDVVHFQFALHLGLGLLFFVLARIKGASVVLTVHDPLPHRWILPRPLRWLEMAFLAIGYKLCHRLIVHNQTGARILAEQFHLAAEQVAVIPHGPLNVAEALGVLHERVSAPHCLRLLAFGSLRENKGLHLAICAIQQLRRDGAGHGITLTIAGRTPNLMEKPYWESCKRLIARQPDGIEVIERVIEDAEVGSLFARHDAVLLPYVQFFSDSGVAMLALSQRRPILATEAGGLGELLRAADCGILIKDATAEAVTASIQEAAQALQSGALATKGENGYVYALEGRSWSVIAQQTSRLYDGLFVSGAKVVLHTPEPASSAALYVEALSKALVADGVPVTVVCPANHQAINALRCDPSVKVRTCGERGTRTDVALAMKVWENLRFVMSSAWTLLRATKPGDAIHLQYILHLPFGLIFLACGWIRRAHIVFTVHDPLPHKFLFPASLRGLEMSALRRAYQWSDVLIVHSEAGKRTLVNVFRIPAEKIRVIVHGPYELKKKVEPCREANRLEVLFFGSLRENKAPHLAIQAVQQLAQEGTSIRLTIAGQVVNRKEEAYWAHCRTLIDPKCDAIRLLEHFIPDADLPELFSNCHCFVLPYTNFSSDSGVAYMALANAKAIVSTGAGGLGWLLEQSRGGILVAEASVAGVADALRLATDLGPNRLERKGRAGADWVLSNCGWPKVAQETRAVYARWIPELREDSELGQPAAANRAPVEAAR
jgi:glycogen(starch) synthase